MKVSPTLMILVGACSVFLLSPYVPDILLAVTVGNKVGTVLLLGLVLAVLAKDRVLALACFLAVAALFLENRRRTVTRVSVALSAKKPEFKVEQLEKPAPNIVPGEVHPPQQGPAQDEYGFEPSEESGSNKFEDPAESYNEKHPLETEIGRAHV